MGGLLTVSEPLFPALIICLDLANAELQLPTFTATFPAMDTVHTKGSHKNHNATVQGKLVTPHSKKII